MKLSGVIADGYALSVWDMTMDEGIDDETQVRIRKFWASSGGIW